VYRVHHYHHRESHLVSIYAGATFPECRTCKHLVRFEEVVTRGGVAEADLIREAQEQTRDEDISGE